WMRLQQQSHSD
ncbi:hypothetical protein AWZ03_015423, partial [Drosophila navojoa]